GVRVGVRRDADDDRVALRVAEGELRRHRVAAVVGALEGEYPLGAGREGRGPHPDRGTVLDPAGTADPLVAVDEEDQRRVRQWPGTGVTQGQIAGERLPVVAAQLV